MTEAEWVSQWIGVLVLLAATLVALYHRTPLWVYAFAAVLLTVWSWLEPQAAAMPRAGFSLVASFLLALSIPWLRARLFSQALLALFRQRLPQLSATEREALEAGQPWWDGELFTGRPDWRRLLEFPAPGLNAEERAYLDGPVRQLSALLDDWRITHEQQDLPESVWRYLREQRFFGLVIPRRYGGLGFSAQAHSEVVMRVAGASISAGVTVMVPNSLGPAELLLRYGTEEQKDHYLPRLARGEEVPCFALTGPEAGSDAASTPDTGVVCRGVWQGRADVLGIRLDFDKRYITLAPVATLIGLAFRLRDPDRLLGQNPEPGITLALLPAGLPGIEIGHRHLPLNQAFLNGPIRGREVFIPVGHIIGGPARAGQGWRMLMECLAVGRAISLPALSTGAAKLTARGVGAYAAVRQQFGHPIGHFEGVQTPLARIAGQVYVMDAARNLTAAAVDAGERPSVLSAILKLHLTERMRQAVNDGMDVLGGRGICLGPRNFLGRVYQSLPIAITVEGANLLTRHLIVFGQGAVRSHPYVLAETRAAQDPDAGRGLRAFDAALCGHLAMLASNALRSLWLGLTNARFAAVPVRGPERRYMQQASRMAAAFALATDAALLGLGAGLKRREFLSARLGDVLSQLYLVSCALKRFHDQGRPAEDLPLLRWVCHDAFYAMQEALHGFVRNLPNPWLAALLRWLIFPRGRPFYEMRDSLRTECAALLLAPSPARDRLLAGCPPQGAALAALESALAAQQAALATEQKLREAQRHGALPAHLPTAERQQAARAAGLLDDLEARRLREALTRRLEVIRVDVFDPTGRKLS